MRRLDSERDPWRQERAREQPPGAVPELAAEERAAEATLRRARQVVDYCFFILYALVGLRIFLILIGARASNPFVLLIRVLTRPFLRWFEGLVPGGGPGRIEWSFVIALGVYVLVQYALWRLLWLLGGRARPEEGPPRARSC